MKKFSKRMEKAANQLIKITRKAHDEVPNLIINEIILKRELKDKELLKEEPELTGKRAEKRKNLANILKSINSQQKEKEPNVKEETFIKSNGFYNCPECSFTTKWSISHLKFHISAVHRKLKPFKFQILLGDNIYINTDWVCITPTKNGFVIAVALDLELKVR